MNSKATVTFQRVEELPDDLDCSYEIKGGEVTVKIRDDLVTAEGARLLEELWSVVLSNHWRRAGALRLVQGDG